MTSVNSTLKALSKGDQIRDFQHAARLFVDNNYELQPRFSHLFHVVFNFTPQAARLFNNQEKLEINMLVKSMDLPSFNIDVQTHNQYNRQVHSQHKINYNPVNVTFHDDQNDLIRSLLHTYTTFYYQDSNYALSGRAYNTNDRYGGNSGDAYGLASGKQRFFKDIRVYSMLQKRFAEYTLINPIVSSLQHDNHAYANGGVMQHSMAINYEAVKYSTGFVNNVNPKGFGEIHYDKSPSPLGVFGAGVDNSIFFRGGFIDAANQVIKDLAAGNILGAIGRGAVIFNNSKDVNLGKVLEKDLTRILGSVLRGNNPLSDVILPNIFGVNLNDQLGLPRGGDINDGNAPVSRNAIPALSGNPNIVFSNNSNVFANQFQQGTSFIDDLFDIGKAIFNPDSSRAAGAPRRLSSGQLRSLLTSPSDSKRRKLDFLNRRIAQLNAQISNPPPGGTPAFIIRERDDLVQRRNLEFGVEV